uniref:Tetratricopeptide repeat protein n=1 Tax=Paracidobacterium acidisoli TaxID=2303751 RepID=A0A372IMY3_9BACT
MNLLFTHRLCAPILAILPIVYFSLPIMALQSDAQNARLQEANAAFRSGYDAASRGDLATARLRFEHVVQLAPTIEEGHSALGAILCQLGEYPAAIVELEKALRLKPADRAAQENLALAYAQSGNAHAALALFDRLSTSAEAPPLTSDLLAAWARALAAAGQSDMAIAKTRDAIAASPHSAALYDQLGSLYAQTEHWSQAQAAFEEAIQMDATLAAAHLHLGITLSREQQPLSAVAELTVATQLAPQNALAQIELGKALAAADQDENAVPHLQKAIDLSPPEALLTEAQNQLAMAWQRLGEADKAIPLFRQVVAAQPRNVSALSNLAIALIQTGDATTAVDFCRRALAIAPADPQVLQDLGIAYLQRSDIDDSIQEFRQGLAAAPDNAQLHYNLGLAWKLKDDLPNAVLELETAARLDPSSPDAPYTLGILYMQSGRFDDAAKNLRAALDRRPTNGDGWAVLGSIYHQQSKYDEAAAALHKAIDLMPNQPGPHITLASVLQEEGKQQEARAERKMAADLTRVAVNRQRAMFDTNTANSLLQKGEISDAVSRYQSAISDDPTYAEAHRRLAMAYEREGRTTDALEESNRAAALDTAHR